MPQQYKEYEKLNLPEIGQAVLEQWRASKTFQKSVELREGKLLLFFMRVLRVPMVYPEFTM